VGLIRHPTDPRIFDLAFRCPEKKLNMCGLIVQTVRTRPDLNLEEISKPLASQEIGVDHRFTEEQTGHPPNLKRDVQYGLGGATQEHRTGLQKLRDSVYFHDRRAGILSVERIHQRSQELP